MPESIHTEHERLKRQVDELQREHDALEDHAFNPAEHRAHKERLKAKIAELRAHLQRLQSSG